MKLLIWQWCIFSFFIDKHFLGVVKVVLEFHLYNMSLSIGNLTQVQVRRVFLNWKLHIIYLSKKRWKKFIKKTVTFSVNLSWNGWFFVFKITFFSKDKTSIIVKVLILFFNTVYKIVFYFSYRELFWCYFPSYIWLKANNFYRSLS